MTLQRLSLREQVAAALRAALVTGALRPGEVHSAPALAKRFGVSSTPVREALLDFVRDGLVTAVPNKGFRVVALDDDDLDEVCQLRRWLEVPAVEQVARTITPEQVAELRPLAAEVERAHADGDLTRHLEADRTFHLTLLGFTGNDRLVELVGRLRALTRLDGIRAISGHGVPAASVAEHSRLVDLLAANDAAGAAALMAAHIDHARGEWAGRIGDAGSGAQPG